MPAAVVLALVARGLRAVLCLFAVCLVPAFAVVLAAERALAFGVVFSPDFALVLVVALAVVFVEVLAAGLEVVFAEVFVPVFVLVFAVVLVAFAAVLRVPVVALAFVGDLPVDFVSDRVVEAFCPAADLVVAFLVVEPALVAAADLPAVLRVVEVLVAP